MGRVEWVTAQVRERKSMVGEGVVMVVGEGEYLEGWWRVMGDIFGVKPTLHAASATSRPAAVTHTEPLERSGG
ncbi:hypothetical protein QC761_0089810 [Podospora bellae-mahoneyi]|uniref:Uncharacterized protein n=1 Tax=Podospora bellae-mahoneyi TaxID=2093777 RepID=A0ABR0FAZ3_9PEZI|nr:hypothetical protein QC761_0089810 [Podospora bellae-mahoneyi]